MLSTSLLHQGLPGRPLSTFYVSTFHHCMTVMVGCGRCVDIRGKLTVILRPRNGFTHDVDLGFAYLYLYVTLPCIPCLTLCVLLLQHTWLPIEELVCKIVALVVSLAQTTNVLSVMDLALKVSFSPALANMLIKRL